MLKHLKIFRSEQEFSEYKNSGDVVFPRVSFVAQEITDNLTIETPHRVDYARLTDNFITVMGGTMYFSDNDEEKAWIDEETGTLYIVSPYMSVDEETGTINYDNRQVG